MPDYIYLLENRLSPAQQNALTSVREAAREEGMTVFLAGGAVRDLTSGSSVRDLDFSVQGDALLLKERLIGAGATLWGEHRPSRTLFFRFPGSVRVEVASTRREEFPKPGKPVYEWASILEDLRRRDFTVNAMAISLNDGSYGLLMDPTNGVADIEQRTLRLVNNYGFLEDPIRLVRATRFSARLGWQMDERTQTRFNNAREEGVISAISAWQKGYETEEIGHEENPLDILRAMEAEGWMAVLCNAWTEAKADVQGLEQMHEVLTRLEMQGIHPDPSTSAMELLTAHMQPKEIEGMKRSFVRPGFVAEWNRLDADAEEFARQLTGKESATASATWKMFMQAKPEAVLWLGLTGKGAAIQNKFKNFFNIWPAARQKVPTALMLEMRITPDLPQYPELLEELFYRTIDNEVETEEQMRAFLEPYSPPAPPPQNTVRRSRAKKSAEKKQAAAEPEVAMTVDHEDEDSELSEMVEEPGQEREHIEVAERDVPAVGETAPPGETPVVGLKAKVPAGKKKAVPEGQAPAEEIATPVQAASRLAGQQLADLGTPASRKPVPNQGKAASGKPEPTPAKAGAKTAAKAPAKLPAKTDSKPAKKAPATAAKGAAKPAAKSAAPAKGAGSAKSASKATAPQKSAPAAAKSVASKSVPNKGGASKGAAKGAAAKAPAANGKKNPSKSVPPRGKPGAAKSPAKGGKPAAAKGPAARKR